MKSPYPPSLPAVVELVAPYIEFAATEVKRQVELTRDVEKIRADTVINTLGRLHDPLLLARMNLDASEKTVDTSATASKNQLLAHIDLIRCAHAGMVRAGISPRSLLVSHRLEKNLGSLTALGEHTIAAVHTLLKAAALPFSNMAAAAASSKALLPIFTSLSDVASSRELQVIGDRPKLSP